MPRVSVPGNLARPPGKPDVLTRAARAYANRSYRQAAELFRSALAKSDVADAPGVRAAVLLDLARSLDRAGSGPTALAPGVIAARRWSRAVWRRPGR